MAENVKLDFGPEVVMRDVVFRENHCIVSADGAGARLCAVREVYLRPRRSTLTYLVEQVHMRFAQQRWPLPDRRTIKARVDQLDRRLTARKRRDWSAG